MRQSDLEARAGADTVARAIGGRVRHGRNSRGWTLDQLAERSGVSAPMLSQVERGETSPTLMVAERIAAGLELRLSQLLRLDEQGSVTVVRAADRRRGGSDDSGHVFEILTAPLPGQRRGPVIAPDAILGETVHAQMRAQRPAGAVFHHALRQPRIDHPAQRLGQRRVRSDAFDPGPQALHEAGAREGRKVHRAAILGEAGGMDHRVEAGRIALARQVKLRAGGAQGRGPGIPQRGAGGEKGPHLSAAG